MKKVLAMVAFVMLSVIVYASMTNRMPIKVKKR